MSQEFFPERPDAKPTIYAYKLKGVETHKGLLKIGYTVRSAEDRISEQLKTSRIEYDIVFVDSAMRNNGSSFTDHDVHRYLVRFKITEEEKELLEL